MISREQQFAEKIHAYTLPRKTSNSRVKDLVDLALLIGAGGLDKNRIFEALQLTFERRGTHPSPVMLAAPPEDWQMPFQILAEECGLSSDLARVFSAVGSFFKEVLASRAEQ